MIASNLRPSWRVCSSVNPFSLLRSSLWNASVGVVAISSSIILSSNSFSSNWHFSAVVLALVQTSSSVSCSECLMLMSCSRWTLKFMLICSWLSKNVHSLSGFFLSCSDSPDACNRLMPSAPSPQRIFSASFSGLLSEDR